MGRIEKAMLYTILATLSIMLLLTIYRNFAAESEQEVYNVSVLVRDASERFLKGVEQAALDYNVDVHLVSGYEAGSGEQQFDYLQRELENDIDAVVLATEDPAYMQERLVELLPRTPIVTVEERLTGARVALHVGVDDTVLGNELGKLIAQAEPGEPCAILCPYDMMPHVTNRLNGIRDAFSELGIDSSLVFCGSNPGDLVRALSGKNVSVLAVLDESMLISACEEAGGMVKLYGIGYVNGVRTYLESERIQSLLVYSEYDAGYMSVSEAVLNANKKSDGKDVPLTVYAADAQSMYVSPLEEILFPIG